MNRSDRRKQYTLFSTYLSLRLSCKACTLSAFIAPLLDLHRTCFSMQLFLRCGGAVGVVPVQAQSEETLQQLMSALGVNSTAAKSSLVRTLYLCTLQFLSAHICCIIVVNKSLTAEATCLVVCRAIHSEGASGQQNAACQQQDCRQVILSVCTTS